MADEKGLEDLGEQLRNLLEDFSNYSQKGKEDK
jgi:hypothetical protein